MKDFIWVIKGTKQILQQVQKIFLHFYLFYTDLLEFEFSFLKNNTHLFVQILLLGGPFLTFSGNIFYS